MKLKLREQDRAVPFVAKKGTTIPPKQIIDTVRQKTGKSIDPETADQAADDLKRAGKTTVMTEFVKDSNGTDLVIGDVLEISNKRFKVQESNGGVCLATMEGNCVMDVTDPRAKALFENSKKVTDESYEPSSPDEPVLSLGHVDDEAGMLKQTVYDIVKNSADLYKRLEAYEAMNTHVDFPHWWQAKVVMAGEYISKASDYLKYESEEDRISTTIGSMNNLEEENNPEPSSSNTKKINRNHII